MIETVNFLFFGDARVCFRYLVVKHNGSILFYCRLVRASQSHVLVMFTLVQNNVGEGIIMGSIIYWMMQGFVSKEIYSCYRMRMHQMKFR